MQHRQRFRRVRTASLLAAVMALAAACGSSPASSHASNSSGKASSSSGKKALVYFIFTGYNYPYFSPMATGIQQVSKYYPNLNIKILSANNSGSTEISQIKDAVAAGAKAIILNPVDSSVTTAAKQASSQGIPIVTIDRDVTDPTARIAFIGDRDVTLGQQTANSCLAGAVQQHLPKPWHVILLQGTLGASTAVDRTNGSEEALKPYESKGTVKVVLNQSANFATDTARTLVSEYLSKTSNVQIIIAGNDAMALGAIPALQAAHLAPGKQVLVCGADAQPESLNAIKAGTQYSTVTHSPYLEAVWAVEALANYLSHGTKPPGKYVNGFIPVTQTVVTKSNVAGMSAWGTPATIPPLPYGTSSSHPSH